MPNYMTFPQAQNLFGAIDGAKQDKLTAGSGINIDNNNVISATGGGGGSYDAGDGISIENQTISLDYGLLTASNLTKPVTGKVISDALDTKAENTYKTVKIGEDNIIASSVDDTIELVAGSNVNISADTTNKKVTISATGGGGGGGTWGSITGTLSDQTDLQNALDAKVSSSEKGANNGVATLGSDGKVPSSQLPASQTGGIPEEELRDTVGWTGKNLIEITATSQTVNDVTFTVNSDGSVTANGTASADAIFEFVNDVRSILTIGESYILNGCPSGGSDSTYALSVRYFGYDTGEGRQFTFTSQSGNVWYGIKIGSGYHADNITFHPMLRKASITDSAYEPYHETVDYVKANRDEVKDVIGWSGKNLLKVPGTVVSRVNSDITHTVYRNSDGELVKVTLNGTSNPATGQTSSYFGFASHTEPSNIYDLAGKTVTLSGGIDSDIFLLAWIQDIGTYTDNGNGVTFTIPSDISSRQWNICVRVSKDTVCNNVEIQPLLRKASIVDDTFEPYHKSVEEVVEQVYADNGILGAKNLFNYTDILNGSQYASVNADGSSIRIQSDLGTYKLTSFVCDVEPNRDYILSGSIDYTRGVGYIGISTYDSDTEIANSGQKTADADVSISFNSGNNSKLRVKLVCTWETSAAGDVSYNNIMLRLATDTDSTYRPYVQTNKKLTESKMSYVDNGALGAKNRFPYPYNRTSLSHNNVDFTVNSDGSITIDGTPRSVTSGEFYTHGSYGSTSKKVDAGSYIFSCKNLPTGCQVKLGHGNSTLYTIESAEDTVVTFSTGNELSWAMIRVTSGTTVNNITVYPMLRLATDPDSTYQPYAQTNKELTDSKMSYADNGILGAKNLLKYPYKQTTLTNRGITFTDNGDGTLKLNGTQNDSSSKSVFQMQGAWEATSLQLPIGNYILTTGSSSNDIFIEASYNNTVLGISENGVLKLNAPDGISYLTLTVAIGATINNVTIKPMVRLATDSDPTYQPYAMTNKQLTNNVHPMITATQNDDDVDYIAGLNYSDASKKEVVNAYTVQKYSNVECMTLYTTVPQGHDTVGTWVDSGWESGSRSGWVWHSALYGVIDDDDLELSFVFDVGTSEPVSVYAYRIDDNVQNGGVNGGAIAFKLNGTVRNASGVKVGVNLKRQRTLVGNLTILT